MSLPDKFLKSFFAQFVKGVNGKGRCGYGNTAPVANLIKKIALDRIRYVVEQLHIQCHLVIVNATAKCPPRKQAKRPTPKKFLMKSPI